MTPLSVAIIGAGNIAGGYDEKKLSDDQGVYTHAGAYRAHGNFELRTVFDPDGERAASFARIWQVGQVAGDLDEIYRRFHDVVSVCSPDDAHYETARQLLLAKCCHTIFVEKPLTKNFNQIGELIQLAKDAGIHIVINFQRKNEEEHRRIHDIIAAHPENLLSVSGHYMKGLVHSGITIIDSLSYLCGLPDAVLTYNKVFNQEIADYSYEFVLFYPNFTSSIKTTDAERFRYNYHIFEMDFLFADRRLTLVDISQGIREAPVTDYAYSGVKVMNDRAAQVRDTKYKVSMVDGVAYVHDVTTGMIPHLLNRPESSYNNSLIVNHIIESYDRGSIKLPFETAKWKK
jgi:predicted dehydrogenase